MSVDPIANLHAMLPNSSEVGKMQNQMNQQINAAQNFGAEKLQEEADEKQLQVQTKDDVEEGKIRNDEEKQQNMQGNSSHERTAKSDATEEEEEKLTDAIRGHNIDIKL